MLTRKIKIDYYSIIKNLTSEEKALIYSRLKTTYDPEFLFSIIIIEKMNRKNISFLENILVSLFPRIVIFLDLSIGICQIKPSTAKSVTNLKDSELIKLLMNPTINIEIMCKLIELYRIKSCTKDEILNLYLTGKKKPQMNRELRIYYELTIWSSSNYFYQKFIEL